MSSDRYDQLALQLAALRAHLLPSDFEATGQYEAQETVETRALAYRVLSHAEIEAYFEDRTVEVVSRARDTWLLTQHVSRVSLCLVAFSGKEMQGPPDTLEAPGANKRKAWPALIDVSEKLQPIIAAFFRYVRNENHGIKERNILAMLLPIGVRHSSLDPAFLTEIDSFGSLRGITAHTSNRTSVRQAVDPAEEFKRLESLLVGVQTVDRLIDELLAEMPLTPSAPGAEPPETAAA